MNKPLLTTIFTGISVNCINAITIISPFTGTLSETWESYASWPSGGLVWHYAPTAIMGGNATLVNNSFFAVDNNKYDLGTSGFAKASDGTKYAYFNAGTITITFQTPMNDFGAYMAGYTGPAPSYADPLPLSISFRDDLDNVIGSDAFQYSHTGIGDGLLDWHGWSSSVGIKSVTISSTRSYLIMDGLQARANIPDTGCSFALLSGSFVMLGALGRRIRK